MYFASVSVFYKVAPTSPAISAFESGFDHPDYHYGAPYNFSFHCKDDFLDKLKQCMQKHDAEINECHIQTTTHSVAKAEYDEYTIDFSFKGDDHSNMPIKFFRLNSNLQRISKGKKRKFNKWLESIQPLAEKPSRFNHIIAVTETEMPCEVIGGFITQSDTAAPADILTMVRKCLYNFDSKWGNQKSCNMIKYMSFPSNEVAHLDYNDTKFVVKEMDFDTGELSDLDYSEYIKSD